MKKNLIVLLATLLVMAMIGEITVRALQHAHLLPDYRKGNISGQPNKVKPPKYTHSNNPILHVEHDITTPGMNRWGTRDPEFTLEKSPDVYRIAIIGDSVSFGYGVNYQESFPYVLQALLNAEIDRFTTWKSMEVINFAVSGYGMDAYLELYRSKVRAFHPDMVLVGYVQNDPAPTNAVDDAVKSMMANKHLRLNTAKYSQLAAWILVEMEKIRGGLVSRQEWAYFQQDDVLARTSTQFRQLHHLLANDHVYGMAVIFPYLLDFSRYPLTKVHQTLAADLQADHFPACDLLPAFSVFPASRYRLQDNDVVHLNADGNRFVAGAIRQCLEHQLGAAMGLTAAPASNPP